MSVEPLYCSRYAINRLAIYYNLTSLVQTKLQITLAVQVAAIHTIIASGAITSVFAQATLPVCPSPSDFFTGRSALLESLNALFDHPGRRVVTIIGKGGAGKTQLTLKFAEQQKAR